MLKILVDRALMHHISFPSVQMVFALTLDQFICHNNLCKETVSRSRSIRNLFKIEILVFEGSKETERKKKKLADLVSNRCHDKTNSIPGGSAPYPLALTKQ